MTEMISQVIHPIQLSVIGGASIEVITHLNKEDGYDAMMRALTARRTYPLRTVVVAFGREAFEGSRQKHGSLGCRVGLDTPQVGVCDLLCEIAGGAASFTRHGFRWQSALWTAS
jgi:hypothetical protein